MTREYIGTKVIWAWPQDRDGAPGYAVKYADGYTSWSPKAMFEEAYRPLDRMTFGDAVHMLKLGRRVARAGWNGKGMWLGLHEEGGSFVREACGTTLEYAPYVVMKTADNKIVPWLASQTDVLAEDWIVLP